MHVSNGTNGKAGLSFGQLAKNLKGIHFCDVISSFEGPGRNFGQLGPVWWITPCVLMFLDPIGKKAEFERMKGD